MLCFTPSLQSTTRVSIDDEHSSITFKLFADEPLKGLPEVWTNLPSNEWRPVTLRRVDGPSFGADRGDHTFWETQVVLANLDLKPTESRHFEFTYRLVRENGQTQWLGADGSNGAIFLRKRAEFLPSNLDDIWQQLPADIAISSRASDSNSGSFCQIRCLEWLLPSSTSVGGIASIPLGQPRGAPSVKVLIIERTSPYWQSTRLASCLSHLSPDLEAQLVIGQCEDPSLVYAIFPLATDICLANLAGSMTQDDKETPLWLRCQKEAGAERDGPAKASCILGWARAEDVHCLMDGIVAAARSFFTQPTSQMHRQISNESKLDRHGLRYCTWNSLGPEMKFSQICEALDGLKQARVDQYFDSVLFDDGWQDVTQDHPHDCRRLQTLGAKEGWLDVQLTRKEQASLQERINDSGYSSPQISQTEASELDEDMEANRRLSSLQDLSTAIRLIKARYPNIKRVGCWITMQGYWRGLEPDLISSLGCTPNAYTIALPGQSHSTLHFPALEELPHFYTQYFSALKTAGVDFIKMDNQAMMDFVIAGPNFEAFRQQSYKAAQSSAHHFFGEENVIHCMGHSSRNVGSELALAPGPARHFRQYDDYFPESEDSHRLNHVHNIRLSLISNPTSLLPDFDMFQSNHPFGAFHASLHPFTSVPIDLTDKPGSLDAALLSSLVGQRPDGQWKALQISGKAQLPAANVFEPVLETEGQPLLLRATAAASVKNTSMHGFWNCTESIIGDTVCLSDLVKTDETQDYVLYSHKSGKARRISGNKSTTQHGSIPLEPRQFDILTVSPFHDIDGRKIACLGLTDKLGGILAMESVRIAPQFGSAAQPTSIALPVVDASVEETTQALSPRPLTPVYRPQSASIFSRIFRSFFSAITSFSSALFYLLGLGWGARKYASTETERTPLLLERSQEEGRESPRERPPTPPSNEAGQFKPADSALHVGLRLSGSLTFALYPAASSVEFFINNMKLASETIDSDVQGDLKILTMWQEHFKISEDNESMTWQIQVVLK